MEQLNNLENDSALNSAESNFDLAGLERYYERQILKVGQDIVSRMFEVGVKE